MVKGDAISNGKGNAYRRWEMDPLDVLDSISNDQPGKPEANAQSDQSKKTELPTEAEVTSIFEHAKKEGFAAGHQEGYALGYTEGRKAAETAVKTEVSRMQMVLSNLDHDLQQLDQLIADDVLALGIALAKKMIAQTLEIKPEFIVPIVQEAIRNLPNAMQHPRLYLHPEDADIVHAHLEKHRVQEDWSIREDEQLTRGGCRIEANGSEVDATLEVRWHRVLAAIGQNVEWLQKND
ncbi:flagellar assembly protein FliH [Nitrosomonas sp. JL21]|uniref:flagellar assembly protein FliH n=1 Tax=Nitrosomonas sp. JL21 TaxID=153949 RepID=UPI00136BB9D4|nr:flagellar assembly protein FliH [Nitrosomonas sp. JL21]MBL8497184.1 flagellar assembly protein FliH [Nitrosomonas sp.]MCC7092333.1 flagellar assembly protein FliH [Nitrosomonas sp.]MXS76655.1 flagellar assembly protein FliH [Nitrosomonas sp. JL21]